MATETQNAGAAAMARKRFTRESDDLPGRMRRAMLLAGFASLPALLRALPPGFTYVKTSNYVSGRSKPTVGFLMAVAPVLGCSIEWLVSGTGTGPEETARSITSLSPSLEPAAVPLARLIEETVPHLVATQRAEMALLKEEQALRRRFELRGAGELEAARAHIAHLRDSLIRICYPHSYTITADGRAALTGIGRPEGAA